MDEGIKSMSMRRGLIQLRGRVRWMLRRYRVRKAHRLQSPNQLPIVFGNAIPKCGSKLLFNILLGLPKLLPFVDTGLNEIKPYFYGSPTPPNWIRSQLDMLRPGDIRLGYMYATPENLTAMCRPGWVNYLIIRDPRDMIISEIFYALQINPGHLLHDYFVSLGEIGAQIDALIYGIPSGELERVGVREHYERFLPWLSQESVHVVHYEELISNPRPELGIILDHLKAQGYQVPIDREHAIDILQKQMAPEQSITFRKGEAGSWEEHFTSANITHFKEEAGELLVTLGYEQSLDW